MRRNARLARYAAPAVFLAAATIAVLIVRSGLENGDTTSSPTTTATATTVTSTTPATTRAGATGTTTGAAGAVYYVIESGDTLAVVADEHDTTVEQLLVLNPEVDPVALAVGLRIRVK